MTPSGPERVENMEIFKKKDKKPIYGIFSPVIVTYGRKKTYGGASMKTLLLLVGVMLIGATGTASAVDYWEDCNSCSSTQLRMKAKQSVPSREGSYYVYVMDFASVTISKYRVSVVWMDRKKRYNAHAEAVTTESHILAEFTTRTKAISDDLATIQAGIVVPSTVVPSAYDLMFNSSRQGALSDYINENLTIWQQIGAPVSIPLLALGKIVSLDIVMPVEFSDGSTIKVQLVGIDGDLFDVEYIFEYKEGSAKDPDGNIIPDSLAAAEYYVGVSSSFGNFERLSTYIAGWFSVSGVKCESEDDGLEISLTCKKGK